MSDLGLSKETVKELGPGAYLVNVFPSSVLVLGLLALWTSNLYPWVDAGGQSADATGIPAILASLKDLGVSGAVFLAFVVLGATVLLRPFQISAVQFLEGYWRGALPVVGQLENLSVERHLRRWSLLKAKALEPVVDHLPAADFSAVVARERARSRSDRRSEAAEAQLGNYPGLAAEFMPTLLGNVLRKAEGTAGQRYGLETVAAFPRLYPYLSQRLAQEWETQANVLDTSATLTIVTSCLGGAASPLMWRLDAWSLLPIALLATAGLSYRGAVVAAGRQSTILSAAFDLHRFDMLEAMHRRLPANGYEEAEANAALNLVLAGGLASEVELGEGLAYWHGGESDVAAGSDPDVGETNVSGSTSEEDGGGELEGPASPEA